ncbi:MAG: polysaccharide biosynthesis protein [Rhodospirillaceae bacterium]|nr:polysaccharide biosynthesis protein [Rhodospirillaceae bacterium]MBT5240798.1 polysaccharide biosynthesis protein [Rhodospirillaceae bacterium]MBT5564732.1 polysaccharide biosynthesis protein [Rhodospirillaceae bacterium]MBT6090135.1 polysaccharide biosynthesis protein [Rhodospirillaceae bacterium]
MKSISKLFTQPRNLLVLLHDTAMAFFAVGVAFFLRLGAQAFDQVEIILQLASVYACIALIIYLFTGLYRHVWAYVSFVDAVNIVRSATGVALAFIPLMFLFTRLEDVPRSVPFIGWFVLVVFLATPRLTFRLIKDRRLGFLAKEEAARIPVLMVGAGDEAAHFIRATQLNTYSRYRVVGLVTATPGRVGQLMNGVEVLGLERDVKSIITSLAARNLAPQRLILTRPENTRETLRDLLRVAQDTGADLTKLPPVADLRAYDEPDFAPRPIALEDLLGRPARSLDREAMDALIRGKRILVTGAGGSIGSELIRQIAAADPAHISMLDHGEFNLYSIEQEMRQSWPDLDMKPIIADVRDRGRINATFESAKPDIVFHAAALKHVPMVEYNPLEGLATNALGTRVIADACLAHAVPEMVLISTDKAVNPANVMGAGKRLAEIYCQAADVASVGTRFITVRFGNVLGSTGSVVPLFQKQLAEGGPLTVTHLEIERYFMTVGEAVELVLQAAALGPGRNDRGAIYVLDMGAPVKIIDLARQIIHLAGKVPDEDIKIKIIGLRPGDKLTEELFHGQEPPVGTDMDGILIARPRVSAFETIAARLDHLNDACTRQQESAALEVLTDLVPELSRPERAQSGPTDHVSSPHLKIVK